MSFTVDSMNHQKIWSGLTTATLLISTLGTATSSYAQQPGGSDEGISPNVSQADEELPSESSPTTQLAPADSVSESDLVSVFEVAKVGEYQSQEQPTQSNLPEVASIYSHDLDGRVAATLYVERIPVLTFLGSSSAAATSSSAQASAQAATSNADSKMGSLQPVSASASSSGEAATQTAAEQGRNASDPVWQASAIAAKINQLHQDGVNAEAINVRWDSQRERYVIHLNGEELVSLGSSVILSDTTGDLAEDALQVANRLRRLLGDAPPLTEIEGRPRASEQFSVGSVISRLSGMASWYGPGFNGRRSASGEVFNQNALTAAHRTLPFGTMVRVTNANTGQSVVVRINDRGPHARGRVIDLSAGAARVIGVMRAGVAPVRLEVLGNVASSRTR